MLPIATGRIETATATATASSTATANTMRSVPASTLRAAATPWHPAGTVSFHTTTRVCRTVCGWARTQYQAAALAPASDCGSLRNVGADVLMCIVGSKLRWQWHAQVVVWA